MRRALGTRSVGHTGTLDPFATGLLIVLVGTATRLARFIEGVEKTYLATARLGFATDTDDLTGAPLPGGAPRSVGEREVAEALAGFVGVQLQRPPAFSAKHVAGERSYRLARRGGAVELAEVEVDVQAMELVGCEADFVTFRTTVSAGTYVRAIARDLGRRLGTGAHLTALRREGIGDFRVEHAVPLESLGRDALLLSPRALVPRFPVHELTAADAAAVGHGRAVEGAASGSGPVALVHVDRLVAIAEPSDGRLQPRVVLEAT